MDTYSIKSSGDTITVTLNDRLDTNNAPLLLDDLKKSVGQPIKKVIFDCNKLVYLSSAGLRDLLFAKQKIAAGGEVLVIGAPEPVIRVIKMSGFDSFLTIRNAF